jgi:hypothetical protein
MAATAPAKNASRADLIKRLEQLEAERKRIDAELAAQSKADLKALVDAFQEHLKANNFELSDALALLGASRKPRARRGTTKVKAVGDKPTPGVTYRHPKSGDEWTAPANLRRVKKWLEDLVKTSGKKYEEFAAKK